MTLLANGPFEVKLNPESLSAVRNRPPGRMSLDKQYHGDLEAVSQERCSRFEAASRLRRLCGDGNRAGTLGGRHGSFVLQHSSTMARGQPQQSITVVPDSGTGELLAGSMIITIDNGLHSYRFDYTLPESPR